MNKICNVTSLVTKINLIIIVTEIEKKHQTLSSL